MFFTWQYLMMRHPGDVTATAMAMWMPPHIGVPMAKSLAYRRHGRWDRTPEQHAHSSRKIEGYWGGSSLDQSFDDVLSGIARVREMVLALERAGGA